jgi:hypothetical protein
LPRFWHIVFFHTVDPSLDPGRTAFHHGEGLLDPLADHGPSSRHLRATIHEKELSMRHVLVIAVLTAIGFVMATSGLSRAATPASTKGDGDVATGAARSLDVSLLGTSDDAFGASVEQSTRTISGTVSGSLGAGSYSGSLTNTGFIDPSNVCIICGDPQPFAVTGELTFTLRNGSFTAEVSSETSSDNEGALLFPSHFVQLNFQLILGVTGGTRRYQHAAGVLALSYTSLTQEGGPGCVPVELGGSCGVPFDTGSLTGTVALGPPFLR